METPVYRFRPEMFPILVEALHPETGAVVWSLTVEEPVNGAQAIRIPPLAWMFGHPVEMRITFADGAVVAGGP
jgi:hypothetical protein